MNRRSFLLGTLMTGAVFTAHALLPSGPEAPKILAEADRLNRWLRAFRLPYSKLLKFKIAFNHTNGFSYGMPQVDQCLRMGRNSIEFLAPKLNIVSAAVFTGCKIIDDENYILTDSPFTDQHGRPYHATVICGDTLSVKGVLNLTIEKGS